MSRIVKGMGHKLQDQQISWAGECPWTETLCLGSVDGKLFILPNREGANGTPDKPGEIPSLELSSDAVNGIAFSGENIALTTRNEILVGYRKDVNPLRLGAYSHTFKGGAHGVVGSGQNA